MQPVTRFPVGIMNIFQLFDAIGFGPFRNAVGIYFDFFCDLLDLHPFLNAQSRKSRTVEPVQ